MKRGGPIPRSAPEPGTARRKAYMRSASPRRSPQRGAGGSREKGAARTGSGAGRPKGFPPDIAALLAERDPWCVHCGSADGLQHHHRRLKGIGGDGRDHTQCACNGVRLCWLCHSWAHSGNGQRKARTEGLIISRFILEPFAADVLVHLRGDVGGQRKFPTCDGRWVDEPEERAA